MEETKPKVTRLLDASKRGILRFLFSRGVLFILLMLLEIGLLAAAYSWLYSYFAWFAGAQTLFMLGIMWFLWNCDMDASAKLTWVAMLAIAPVPASLLLGYTRLDVGQRMVHRRLGELTKESGGFLKQRNELLTEPEVQTSGTAALQTYLGKSGTFPLYKGTEVSYYPLGERMLEALLEELEAAEQFIFLEYFIVDEGEMWGRILEVLTRKAAQGVEVRVMYDGMCEISTLSADYPQRLQKLGIACKPFMPVHPVISTVYNYRDHRKIAVIDNRVAFTGGVNLADEYINRRVLYGHWKDTAVKLKGEAVSSFTLMFLQMWNLTEREPKWEPCLCPFTAADDGYVLPYDDVPMDDYHTGESVYMDILNRANRYVHIMSPYLILDNKLEHALRFAAERGVEVELILPGIPDKILPYALAKSHYRSLLQSGVKIFEYTPGFVHAKVFVSDDEKAVVGTINMDYRSLYHHYECAVYLLKSRCIADIEADFRETRSLCREVTLETVQQEKLYYKILGGIMKLVAPLM